MVNLSCCVSFKRELNLGERIAKELMINPPVHESTYILLYAELMDWEKESTVRRAMGKKGIRKVPGSAMIELGGVMSLLPEIELTKNIRKFTKW